MADQPDTSPKTVQMPRAVHELATGKATKIDSGTIITDDIAREHKLSTKDLAALTDTGAVELVDVLVTASAKG